MAGKDSTGFVPTQFLHLSGVIGSEKKGIRIAVTNDGQMEKQRVNEVYAMTTTHARTMIKYILIGGGGLYRQHCGSLPVGHTLMGDRGCLQLCKQRWPVAPPPYITCIHDFLGKLHRA